MNRYLCLLVLLSIAHARPKPVVAQTGASASWAPTQATGAPNVPKAGDDARAWATLGADSGLEWLEVGFGKPVTIAQINIHETFNPGAISKVVVRKGEAETVLWEGTSEVRSGTNVLRLKAARSVASDTVRIYLDTTRVTGWNEIDAVELVGLDGSKQWAARAQASSSYAFQTGYGGTLQSAVGKTVKITTGGSSMNAKLLRREGDFLVLERNGKTILVAVAAVQRLEF